MKNVEEAGLDIMKNNGKKILLKNNYKKIRR